MRNAQGKAGAKDILLCVAWQLHIKYVDVATSSLLCTEGCIGMNKQGLCTFSCLGAFVVISPAALFAFAATSRRNDFTLRESSPLFGLIARPAS